MTKRFVDPRRLHQAFLLCSNDTEKVAAAYLLVTSKPGVGETRQGLPDDYRGDDSRACNAITKSGRPCRALATSHNGRCRVHSRIIR
jgi:hypothetical protein